MRMWWQTDGTWAPAQLPTELAWEAHMASCTSLKGDINMPQVDQLRINCTSPLLYMAVIWIMALTMDGEHDRSIHGRALTPLRGEYPPGFADSSFKT